MASEHVFVDKADEYECGICHEVARAIVATPCGHFFCDPCITTYRRTSTQCPICRTDVGPPAPAFADRRVIAALRVRCIHRERGCAFLDAQSRITAHEIDCPLRLDVCNHCSYSIAHAQMEEHQQRLCPERPVPCPDSPVSVPHSDLSRHATTCSGRLVDCPVTCGIPQIRARDVDTHLKTACEAAYIPCPLSLFGCDAAVRRRDMRDHLCCIEHHTAICREFERIRQEASDADRLREQLRELKESVRDLSRRLSLMDANGRGGS